METGVFKEPNIQKMQPVLIKQMVKIVEQIVVHTKFRTDFYVHDLASMQTCCTFAWYVYDCGTHFMPLHDIEAVRKFQRDWVGNIKDFRDTRYTKDTDRLYVCDTISGSLNLIYDFEKGNLFERLQKAV
ncbi:hypothetical protein P4K96_04245 [Bacillus cereus]|nr:hypothetical protein [Bacillus cereus]